MCNDLALVFFFHISFGIFICLLILAKLVYILIVNKYTWLSNIAYLACLGHAEKAVTPQIFKLDNILLPRGNIEGRYGWFFLDIDCFLYGVVYFPRLYGLVVHILGKY